MRTVIHFYHLEKKFGIANRKYILLNNKDYFLTFV